MKTLLKLSALVATSVALSFTAYASDWTGGGFSIPWSSNGNPGWNGTGIPDAVGAVANFSDSTITGNPTTFADIPVTVGTISLNANADISRGVVATNNITLNNGGSGATISNTNPSPTTNNFFAIGDGGSVGGGGGGNFVLADDLLVTNTGGSTAPGYAILIASAISGNGNVTFSTFSNPVTAQHVAPGSIKITGQCSYVGNVLVQQGTIAIEAPQAFGDPGNMVTLGQAGQGNVTVMITALGLNVENAFTVTAGTGGTTTLGETDSQGSTIGSSATVVGSSATAGDITLNGNLIIDSWVNQANSTPGAFILGGIISGPGSLTFTSSTQVQTPPGDPTKIISELDTFDNFTSLARNTYQGGTIVNTGTLIANGNGALGNGNVCLTASNVQLTLTSHGTDKIADTATLSLFDNTDKLNLSNSAIHPETVGALIINGVAQAPGTYNKNNLPEISATSTGAILNNGILSAQITSVAHTTDGHFHITGLTNPTLTVTVHTSNDLVTYDPGVSVTADTSGVFHYDDATGLTPQRFYKATYP